MGYPHILPTIVKPHFRTVILPPRRVAQRLFLCFTNQDHALRLSELGDLCPRGLIFLFIASKVHDRQVVGFGKLLDRRAERLRHWRQRQRRGNRKTQLLTNKRNQATGQLKVFDIAI